MSDDDHVYMSLVEASQQGETHWAFGTGFTDPLLGVDTALPVGVDGPDLSAYCLMLGDDALVLAQRLIEWCTSAPELEDEVALANIALDLLGQARLLLSRAGQADGSGRTEDDLAFLRDEREFRNVRLVEAADRDFAHCVARLLLFACARLALFQRLAHSADPVLAAVAARGANELAYHREYAAGWVVRLGDGTELSRERMQRALDAVRPLLAELFTPHPVELRLAAEGAAVDPAVLAPEVERQLAEVAAAAGLALPPVQQSAAVGGRAGRDGVHTEEMGHLLAELQCVARAHPGALW
jgi:ring-1,2-phenylacetyl-CoA epoxidase subunit PaaC